MAVSKGIVVMILGGLLVYNSAGSAPGYSMNTYLDYDLFGVYLSCDQYERKLKFI